MPTHTKHNYLLDHSLSRITALVHFETQIICFGMNTTTTDQLVPPIILFALV